MESKILVSLIKSSFVAGYSSALIDSGIETIDEEKMKLAWVNYATKVVIESIKKVTPDANTD